MPPRISQIVSEIPARSGAPLLGWIQPHVPDFRTPNTASERPDAERITPTTSSFGRSPGGVSTIPLLRSRIAITMSTSPKKTSLQLRYDVNAPPISGPTAAAIAPAAARRPYAFGRALAGKFVAPGGATRGRIGADPHPWRKEQPR